MASWHFEGVAERTLDAKGLRADLDAMGKALDGTDLSDRTAKREMEMRRWRTSERIWEDASYTYDGFKDGVAVEVIGPRTSGERSVVYGFVKMELGRDRPNPVEVGVLVVSTKSIHFAKAKDWAGRLQSANILRLPVAILGIKTR